MRNILIMTVGLPRSGKTVWAQSTCHPIVCPDKIRLALHGQRFEPLAEPMVWAIAKIMVRALYGAGHKCVILDACSHTANRRDDWKFPEEWLRKYLVCDINKITCIERAQADLDIIPVIEHMAAAIEYDGIMYGDDNTTAFMRHMDNHIKDPDGTEKDPQIYHEGVAGEDV
jgi:hypothetical protein